MQRRLNLLSRGFLSILVFLNLSCQASFQIDPGKPADPLKLLEAAKRSVESIQSPESSRAPRFTFESPKVLVLRDIAIIENMARGREESQKTFERATEMAESLASTDSQALVVGLINDIALAQLKLGAKDGMRNTLNRSLEAADKVTYYPSKVRAYQAIAQIQISAGMVDEAQKTTNKGLQAAEKIKGGRELSAQTYKTGLLSAIAISYVNFQNMDLAREAVEEANEILGTVPSSAALAVALRDIATAQVFLGDKKTAMENLDLAFRARASLDTFPGESLETNILDYLRIAEVFAKSGNQSEAREFISNAIEMAQEYTQLGYKDAESFVWRKIAMIWAEMGEIEEALQAEERVIEKLYKGDSLPLIARGMLQSGDLKGAQSISQKVDQGKLYGEIALAQVLEGDVEGAERTASLINDWDVWNKSLVNRGIAWARVKGGEIRETLDWARVVESPVERTFILMGMAMGLLGIDRLDA